MSKPFCIAAEFKDEHELLEAASKTREAGYSKIEAYSPFAIHGMCEAIGYKRPILAWVIFGGGITGMLVGFGLAYWVSVLELPYNVGGRPLNSWPSFIPVTFETTVLFAAGTAVIGMLAFNGLPRPHHPIFNHPKFEGVSQDKFLLTVEADDPKYSVADLTAHFEGLEAVEVIEVEDED